MPYVEFFNKLNSKSVGIAGGKGASLGEMTNAGIPVPEGFVVLSESFEDFLKKNDLVKKIDSLLNKASHEEEGSIIKASNAIQKIIIESKIPQSTEKIILESHKKLNSKYVAVRSSATSEDSASAAWAGQLDSYLNTTSDKLLANVKRCWASLFNERAIFYRIEKGLQKEFVSVAVVVQKMIESEVSGIAFSVHPVTQNRDHIIIEAGYGLGEAIVSGQITPDNYIIDKTNFSIVEKNVSEQKKKLSRTNKGNEWITINGNSQKLSDKQIIELSKIIVRIEKHYGFPCDIEFAYEKGKFYIVQSRPITTLAPIKVNKKLDDKEIISQKEIVLSPIYTRDKSLFYFYMWNESDRKGYKKYLNHDVQNNLFLKPSLDRKTTVYYNSKELEEIDNKLMQKIAEKEFLKEIVNDLNMAWKYLKQYTQNKQINTLEEFKKYYSKLTDFWAALNTPYTIPKLNADEKSKNIILDYRHKTEMHTAKLGNQLHKFFEQKYPLLKKYSMFIAPQDIEMLNDKRILEILKLRERGFALYNNKLYSIEEIYAVLKKNNLEIEKTDMTIKELKGSSAWRGKVTGRARLILKDSDISEIVSGEILVTEMTQPHYISAMKKVAAIITDEGGVTCHAAIVAREIKKPCVIGTKNATRIIKNGDFVEVDADNGIVTILEHQSDENKSSKSDKDFYELMFSRDFCLPNIEIWCRGESTEPRRWTSKQQPVKPYIMFERNNGTVNCYMTNKGIDWIKNEIRQLMKKDRNFVKDLVRTFKKQHKILDPIINTEKILNHKELVEFMEEHIREWPWFEGIWWTLEILDEENPESEEFKIVQKARAETDNYGDACDAVLVKSLKRIFPQLGELSKVLTIEEIKSKKIPSLQILQNRMHYYIYTDDQIYEKKTLEDIEKIYNIDIEKRSFDKTSTEFRGQTAYSGKVIGRVRKIISKSNVSMMQEGEILVSPMTTVDFLPAMKKAAGFITDEGGITCHAAIVAREIKKPCIIGTKIATRILHNGDEIELDATNGIVKILSKKITKFPQIGKKQTSTEKVSEKKVMVNLQSREHSLAYCYVWQISNQKESKDFFESVNNILFINKGMHRKTEVWYQESELQEIFDETGRRTKKDPKFFNHVKEKFLKYHNKLIQIMNGKKKIKSLKELEQYYKDWISWWTPMATIFVLPESKTADGTIKEKALALRSKTEKYSDADDDTFIKSFIRLKPKFKDVAYLMTPNEIFNCDKLTKIQIDEMRKRENGYVFFNGSMHKIHELDLLLKKHNKILDKPRIELSDIIKGNSVCAGKVTGKIRIIHTKAQLKNFNHGEILVTEMTSPDYVPAMKKAAAIITDEGGTMCHAAIVSRELSKPCIVGTRIGTQALKDGDYVEVDANTGTVKRLKTEIATK